MKFEVKIDSEGAGEAARALVARGREKAKRTWTATRILATALVFPVLAFVLLSALGLSIRACTGERGYSGIGAYATPRSTPR